MIDGLTALDGEGPLWLQIRRAVARPILAGIWTPGSRIPSEHDLMAHYHAARMTVHRAVRSLADEGLVERRRKIGTVVAVRGPERSVFEIWDLAADVARSGGDYAYRILERASVPDRHPQRAWLGIADDTPLMRIVGLHSANGQPMEYEERLINLEAAPQAATESFVDAPPGSWLLRHVAWTEAEHTIRAAEAAGPIARHLGIKPGTACLIVERRTWSDRQPITFVRIWHPGERHRLVGRFRPSSGG